jgi:hypothetical protein
MNQKAIAIIGCIVLIAGCFAPLLRAPIMGTVNSIHDGTGDGMIVLALAITCLTMAVFNRFWFCYVTAFGSAGMIAFWFIRFRHILSQIKADMDTDLKDNPFRGIADAMMGSVTLDYGWFILMAGSVLVLWAAILKPDTRSPLIRSADDLK